MILEKNVYEIFSYCKEKTGCEQWIYIIKFPERIWVSLSKLGKILWLFFKIFWHIIDLKVVILYREVILLKEGLVFWNSFQLRWSLK